MENKKLIDFLCEENEAFAKDLIDGHDLIASFDGHFVAWDVIIEACGNGADGYSQSPLELISRIVNERDELSQNVCDVCSPDNYGWVFNRVEGRGACTCMLEAEPFQILQAALERIAKFKIDDPSYPSTQLQAFAREALRAVLPLDYAE